MTEVALAVMGLLLGLLFLDHLIVVTYGHPILEAPESVIGPWKGNVNIPCTYGPLQGYTQVLVKWLVQRDSDPVTIFLRDFSGDHIQQAKYQSRLNVNSEVPGDVSLQLKTLEMDDRSHYTCEVTWQTPDGNQVVRDEIIELRVQKLSVSKPTVTTDSGYGFTVLQGTRISLQCHARGSPPISYVWYKEETNNSEPIIVTSLSTLLFTDAVVADSGNYFCTAKGRVGSEQRSNVVKFVVKAKLLSELLISTTPTSSYTHDSLPKPDSSKSQKNKSEAATTMKSLLERTPTVNSSWAWTTEVQEVHSYLGDTSAGPGKGLPIFFIILIISLCCMVVFSMVYIMFCRKKSQQDRVYEVFRVSSREASDSGETMRVPIFESGCYSEDPASWTLGNDYSDEPYLDQEYQIIAQINGDYACLLNTVSPDHDLPTTEGKSVY